MIFFSRYRFTLVLIAALVSDVIQPAMADDGLSLTDILRTALTNQPAILIKKKEIDFYKGTHRSYKGQFDWRVTASLDEEQDSAPLTVEEAELAGESEAAQRVTTSKGGIEKQFAFGPVISAGLENVGTDDLDLGLDSTDKTSAEVSLLIPLLRGRGWTGTAGSMLAAELDVEASLQTFLHEISLGISRSARAYWSYLSAAEQLEIYGDSETQMEKLVKDVQELVDAELRPAADLDQLRASLADKTAQRINAEQSLLAARNQLGEAIGLEHEAVQNLPPPSDPFPHPPKLGDLEGMQLDTLFEEACLRKSDIRAAYKTLEAKSLLLKAARRNRHPQVDLVVSAGNSVLDNGDRLPQYAEDDTTYASVMIQCAYPIGNDTRRGELEQREAEYEIAKINAENLARTAKSRIETALEGLKRSSRAVLIAEDGVRFYETTMQNEHKKLKLGKSTVIDLLYLEDKYRSSLVNLTKIREAYANALVSLRHETAAVITHDEDTDRVVISDLTRIPAVEGAE